MLKIKANPTFQAKVQIPTYDDGMEEISVEFKYMTVKELSKYISELPEKTDVQIMTDIIVGWSGVDGDFNKENVEKILDTFHGFSRAVWAAFLETLTQVRAKN